MILDYTTMSDFLLCRKRYYWRHIRNVVPVQKSLSLQFGQAIHMALKAYYTDGDAIKTFLTEYQPIDIPENEKRTVEHGMVILQKYAEQYATNLFEVIECNGSHLVQLSDTVTYAARMDAVIKWQGKTIYVMEHKTTSSLGYYFFENFTLNYQVDGYIRACRDKYGECGGVLIDAISTAKQPRERFMRDIATRTIEQQNNFGKEVIDIARNITFAIEEDSYVLNKNSCTYYGACPYRQLCLHGEGALDMYETSIWDAKEGKEVKDENNL